MDSDNDSYHSENEFYYPDEISYFLNVKRTRTPGSKMAAVKIQHKNRWQSSLRKKIINTLFAGLDRSVLGKTVPSVLSTALGLRPRAVTQDLWHNFSQYGPPGRQITYMYCRVRFYTSAGQSLSKHLYANDEPEYFLPDIALSQLSCKWQTSFQAFSSPSCSLLAIYRAPITLHLPTIIGLK